MLEGRGAVITGTAQRLGRAIAEPFVAGGARVVLGDVDLALAEQMAEKLDVATGPGPPLRRDGAEDDARRRQAGARHPPAGHLARPRAVAAGMRERGSVSTVKMSSISHKAGNLGKITDCAAEAGIVGLIKAATH